MSVEVNVRWEDLLLEEFEQRLAETPVAYLPIGLCEPHGHIAAFGLDTHKAVHLCEEAARRFGGVVAPTMGYHVHETGYHAPWLEEVMGEANPRLVALPPHIVYEAFLYQLRAFRNAGFRAVVAISGHHGGNQEDLRRIAAAFDEAHPLEHFVCSDPELVEGHYAGDHAGRYEISQLLAIRPDLVDLSRVDRARTDPLGRFAQNPDASEATVEIGRHALELSLAQLEVVVRGFDLTGNREPEFVTMSELEPLWERLRAGRQTWRTLNT
jgi:creatinine amidohydrolase